MKRVWEIALGTILAFSIMSVGGLAVTWGVASWTGKQLEEQMAMQQERIARPRAQQDAKQAAKEAAAEAKRRVEAESAKLVEQRERETKAAEIAWEDKRQRIGSQFEEQYVAPSWCANPQADAGWARCVEHRRKAKAEFMEEHLQ